MNLKKNGKFDWDGCKKFEETTLPQFEPLLQEYWGNMKLSLIEDIEMQKKGMDFICKSPYNTFTIECKSDTHDTGNLFLEEISNLQNHKLGWTLKAKADILAYAFFTKELLARQLLIIDMQELIKWFKENRANYDIKHIKNHNYESIGRAVPIKDLPNEVVLCNRKLPRDL